MQVSYELPMRTNFVSLAAGLVRAGKVAFLRLTGVTGLNRAVRDSRWRRQRFLILCYHGVSLDDEHQWSDLYVSAQHLRRRFAFLRDEGYNVLPLAKALEGLEQAELPERAVVLTFDDGAHDFHAKAYPLLREFGYHATLYQTTYYSTYQRPVFDPLASYLLWKGRGKQVELPPELGGTQQVPLDDHSRLAMHLRIRSRVNALGLGAEAKDRIAQLLADQVGVDYSELLKKRLLHLMTPEEIADLDPEVVSVQLHTHRHRTPQDERLFCRELADNKAALHAMRAGNEPLAHFCYPSGDHDRRFFPWLEAHGIRSATTCDPGIVAPSTPRLLLPRLIDTMLTPDAVFEAWLSGIAAFLPRRRR